MVARRPSFRRNAPWLLTLCARRAGAPPGVPPMGRRRPVRISLPTVGAAGAGAQAPRIMLPGGLGDFGCGVRRL